MNAKLFASLALAAACTLPSLGVESVRVDASSGAPRLMVDGKPVRARIFWGAPAGRPLSIGPAPKQLSFEFSPAQDEPAHATMHFRFGHSPGQVFLDDIRVVEVETGREVIPTQSFEAGPSDLTGRWLVWPPGANNTVGTVEVRPGSGRDGSGGLSVSLKAPPNGPWPDFHIHHQANLALRKGHRYRVSLWARAQPARGLTVAFYRPGQRYVYLGGPPGPFESQIKLAAAVGVDLVSFPVSLPWPRPGEPEDWSAVDAECQAVLDANPKALLLPRLGMDPPAWWIEAHPGEAMVWDTPPGGRRVAVVASPQYRREAAARLTALVVHVEAKFGPHVAGYHPCGQNTGEWFYEETWGPALSGYAPADQRAWRAWLRARYHDDAALRAAWRDPSASLATAAVPDPKARRAAPSGVLRDPAAERPLIDFAEFQQQMMAECVCQLARAVRQATGGRKLVVFFYGYVFEFGAIRNGAATSGHYALRRVLECPDINVLCSPISYFDRGLGESGPAMTAAESVALANKMWLYEDDTRTYLSDKDADFGRVDTLEESVAVLVRNTAQCALRNFGAWWMDLGAAGWFDDPRIWAAMVKLQALDQPLLEHPLPFRPEVAAVIDEQSMLRLAAGGQVVGVPGIYEVRCPLGRMGCPYGQYLLDDVVEGRVHAKVFVLLNAWCLSPGQREKLLAATRGSLRIWCYAPGYHEGYQVSLEAMQQLTGFRLAPVSPATAWAKPTPRGSRLGLREPLGVKALVKPLFAAADARPEETLAAYADGAAAVALRKQEDGWSLFVGPPGLSSELLRLAARQAGAHLFTQTDCNVYANGPYVVLHASQNGPIEIDVGCSGRVRDLLTGETLGQGPKITLATKKGDTRVLVVGDR